jgi:glutathione synthase/RimK-type ligase-like ATP-grasp enzyme
MRLILSAVSSICSENTDVLYENQKNGFLICGVDFMIDDTGTVFLIEINQTPGIISREHENSVIFCNKLFDWLNECVLEPFFKGTDASASSTYLPLLPISF